LIRPMKKTTNFDFAASLFRQKAEELLKIRQRKPATQILDTTAQNHFHELELNQIELELLYAELKHTEAALLTSEKSLQEKTDDLLLLANSSFKLLDFNSIDEIYHFLGSKLLQLSGADYMLLSEYNELNSSTTPKLWFGIDQFIGKIVSTLGKDINQIQIPVQDVAKQMDLELRKKIYCLAGGLHELTVQKVPKAICVAIEKILGIREIYSIGFIWKGHYYGGASFGFKKGNKIKKSDLIDTISNQASLALSRKYAEKSLTENEKKYRGIFENIQDVYYETATDGTILELSPSIKLLSKGQYTREDLIGKPIYDYYEDRDARSKLIQELKKCRQIIDYEIQLINKDGSLVNCSISAELIIDPQGNPEKIVGTFHDITNRKQSEEDLKSALTKAKESDRLKSAFLANISHEIRTPMNGILGFSTLLKEPGLSGDQQKEYISFIEKSGERMLNTINDLMDISKIEAGQMNVIVSEVNMNERINNLHHFFKPKCQEKGIQFLVKNNLSPDKSILNSDRNKIDAILSNLILNAIKYTPQGSIEVGCGIVHAIHESYVQCHVKDTGIGIPLSRQQAIFDRFVHADIEDNAVYEGSGLGLSISKAYVEMLGGKIWVESTLGAGSTFYFTVPYQVHPQTRNNTEEEANPGKESVLSKKLNILIAEDDENSKLFMTISLERLTNQLFIARTGLEAVKLVSDHPGIDLVLMDIRMPELNGYEATRRIREFNSKVVIIAQTAHGLAGDQEKAIEAGCNDYISKPINRIRLLEVINRHLRSKLTNF